VTDGVITAVGTDAEVRRAMGSGAEYLDLDGRMLCPGFQDAHVHPHWGGLIRVRCNLEDVPDLEGALEVIRAYVHEHPDEEWIRGGGWNYRWFPDGNAPASLLDSITDRPVYLTVADGHSGWANTAAFERAGINRDTPDPPDGRIERLPDGSPQGTLHEGAMGLMATVVPPDTVEDIAAGLLEGQRFLHSVGVTAWQDAWVPHPVHTAYRRIAASGELKSLVRGALWWERDKGIEQLDRLVEKSWEGVGPYVPKSVKLMLDGVCENQTAALLGPYYDGAGNLTENTGFDFIEREPLAEIVTAIDAAGLQCHFHALGDRAVRNGLDAVARARAVNGWKDTRPHLAHLQIVDPSDIPRFRRLGAVANAQPLWAVADVSMTELTIPFIGPERTRHQYPWRSLLAAGATLAMGSDWSVTTPDVMQQVSVAVHRSKPGLGEAFLPEQRITVLDALSAFTSGSAYANHLDTETGSIEVGKRADLVLLAANPLESEDIGAVGVDMTLVGGEVVHDGGMAA
jgi:predicted amidohydrolase YtcJ